MSCLFCLLIAALTIAGLAFVTGMMLFVIVFDQCFGRRFVGAQHPQFGEDPVSSASADDCGAIIKLTWEEGSNAACCGGMIRDGMGG